MMLDVQHLVALLQPQLARLVLLRHDRAAGYNAREVLEAPDRHGHRANETAITESMHGRAAAGNPEATVCPDGDRTLPYCVLSTEAVGIDWCYSRRSGRFTPARRLARGAQRPPSTFTRPRIASGFRIRSASGA